MTEIKKLDSLEHPQTLDDEKIDLSNGTIVDIKLVVDDLAAFNRYVIREHAYKLQASNTPGNNSLPKSCISNCIYDEMSGWLDNPCLLGFSILDISVAADKIKEEEVNLELEGETFEVSTFELVKFIGELAGKDHQVGDSEEESRLKLIAVRQKARYLLKNLVRMCTS